MQSHIRRGITRDYPSCYCIQYLILYFAYWWHIYLWDLCFFCVQVLSVLLYEAESHGFQEKSPSQYCKHILVLFCFDLLVILYFAYWWHIYLWDLCFFCVQVLSICCMKLNHMVSRRNHLLDIVNTFWYYSALTFWSILYFCLLVAYLSVGFVLLLCPSNEHFVV